ncbi:MAG TPA: hypothetical protein VHD38_02295 [Candidatus Paceibacterota bacterium]|nr:hypothetical protein [Candidatus Paceibacterota bacterium]
MNTAAEHASQTAVSWIECSYEIHFTEATDLKHIDLMKTKGQKVEGRVTRVPSGKLRVTRTFVEGRDSAGIPFNWSLALVEKVVVGDGTIIWRNGGPA